MPEALIVQYGSPTLAGLKTGSLFSCAAASEAALIQSLRAINRRLGEKGLCIIPLGVRRGRFLIYLYRPGQLRRDLSEKKAGALLKRYGYRETSPNRCLLRLMEKLKQNEAFPHEIGLFLGYPPEDVQGFIDNKAACSKCVGCWKVYGDEAAAQKTFAKYKKCTHIYRTLWQSGKSLEKLAVTC